MQFQFSRHRLGKRDFGVSVCIPGGTNSRAIIAIREYLHLVLCDYINRMAKKCMDSNYRASAAAAVAGKVLAKQRGICLREQED